MLTAVVTGAAREIGRALSRQLARDGYAVHLADIAPSDDAAAEIGGISHLLDVVDADAEYEAWKASLVPRSQRGQFTWLRWSRS